MTKVKALLIGGGAREHAIAEALVRSTYEPKLYALMGVKNPGIKKLVEKSGGEIVQGKDKDPNLAAEVAGKFSVDFAFIGPEEPLFHGVCDAIEDITGIPCVGARQKPAQLEQSKAFMRRLMWKHNVEGRLRFKAFLTVHDAIDYIDEYAESVAIKPARQAGGKGVKVIADVQAYLSDEKKSVKEKHAQAVFEEHMKPYDDIEDRILIEERVEGPEYTAQCFTDGNIVEAMPIIQDHKHAFEEDIGPETGGMGCISGKDGLLPFITAEEKEISIKIVQQLINSVEKEVGEKYKGIVAGQMMLTDAWGPTIIECYSRFGDPEGTSVLPLLKTDLVEISEAIIGEKLHKIKMEWDNTATVVKCIAPKGYPRRRDLAKDHPLAIDINAIEERGGRVYFGSISEENGQMVTKGSRAIEIWTNGETIEEASKKAESCIPFIKTLDGWGLFHRKDIGSPELLKKRIELGELQREIFKYRKAKGLVGRRIDWIPGKGKLEYIS